MTWDSRWGLGPAEARVDVEEEPALAGSALHVRIF
jgi:hypothetical protein